MALKINENPATATKGALFVDNNPDGRLHPKRDQHERHSRRHACPIIALLGLLTHLVISGLGVAISVLVVHFHLEVIFAGTLDLVARILLFVASCMSIFYVLMHAFAAREHYVKGHGSPQIFGYFSVAVAVLIARLSVPVWTGSVVFMALVAAQRGFNAMEGLKGNVVWVQLGIASLGLISLIVMVVITETTERPFATLLFSKTSFIKAADTSHSRVDTFDLSVSRAGYRREVKEYGKVTAKGGTELEVTEVGFDRSTINTPESPYFASADNLALRMPAQKSTMALARVRSQPIPTPLEAVFTADGISLDVQESPRNLAWRPPRDSTYSTQRPHTVAESDRSRFPEGPCRLGSSTTRDSSSSSQYSTAQLDTMPKLVDGVRSTQPDYTSPSPGVGTSTEIPFSAPVGITNPEQDSAQPQDGGPTLAKLLGQLSTRAAARRRNSLLGHQTNLIANPSIDNARAGSSVDAVPAVFDQPADFVQPVYRERAPRTNSLLVRQADLGMRRSIDITRAGGLLFISQASSDEFVEIPRPPQIATRRMMVEDESGPQAPPLVRSNTAGPLLVRNFSRPGAPRPKTAGGEAEQGGGQDDIDGLNHARTSDRRSRSRIREEHALVRRSRSLPPVHQDSNTTVDTRSRFERNASTSGRRKGSQPSTMPRFSAFPRAPTLVPTPKVKGLGQGSTRRLDERIEKWKNGVVLENV